MRGRRRSGKGRGWRGRSRGEEEGEIEIGGGEQRWCLLLSNLTELRRVVVGWLLGKRRRRKKWKNLGTMSRARRRWSASDCWSLLRGER